MNGLVRKAVLLAAGRGTRMRDLTNELPKPMIVVRGKPILHHIIDGLHQAGISEVLIIVGYRAEVVRHFFGGQCSLATNQPGDLSGGPRKLPYHGGGGMSRADDEEAAGDGLVESRDAVINFVAGCRFARSGDAAFA